MTFSLGQFLQVPRIAYQQPFETYERQLIASFMATEVARPKFPSTSLDGITTNDQRDNLPGNTFVASRKTKKATNTLSSG